jgi:hypothetical protein
MEATCSSKNVVISQKIEFSINISLCVTNAIQRLVFYVRKMQNLDNKKNSDNIFLYTRW